MSACRPAVFVAFIALQAPALALTDASPLRGQAAGEGAAHVMLAQAKKASGASGRDAEALYRQCREAVVRMYGRASGLRDPSQDSLNGEMRMQEAGMLDSKIDYCIQNGGRP